jgi:signal transduction histidine kinase
MVAKLRLKELPLRTKVLVTLVVAGLVLLGVTTHLSFRYWKGEALATSEQQALLAATSVRSAVEAPLAAGRPADARRALKRLVEITPVTRARVYGREGAILLSTEVAEEGRRAIGVWIPPARTLPAGGVVRATNGAATVVAYVPLAGGHEAQVLEVEFSVAAVTAAMDRGARLGIGLVIGSVLAFAAIFVTLMEREVVGPLQRMDALLAGGEAARGGPARGRRDEVGRIQASVTRLLEREREAAAARRAQAEREGLAEVGQLAAEMAHEFKRPLASLTTALSLVQQEYELDPRQRELLAAMEAQLGQVTETMKDLLSLARPLEPELQAVSLHALLDGALVQLSGHPAAAAVAIRCDYDPNVEAVEADERRLEQAVLNLLLNGAEAMPGGGTLTLRTRAAGAGWVEIAVADTGVGIPPEKLDEVLKPFRSTKPQGTGLGLPLVARVVAAHGGRLGLESEPGVGTVVRIHLPVRHATQRGTAAATRTDGADGWRTHAS